MATAFLDDDEVYILTGYKKPKLQKAWLARLNIPFEENAKGKLAVYSSHFQAIPSTSNNKPAEEEPNFGYI
ncbi:MAG: DUF4224 domain-containing protein [Symbiopectobacterium sp.]|uniref:DUF4224 domain-containing protein n=1 Tax=Symbiopectobacterium sp. TaxID=2952789 RepID=UPI003F2DEBE4